MDLLEIALPYPDATSTLEREPRMTAWGPEEDPPCTWQGHLIGRLVPVAAEPWPHRAEGMPPALASQLEGWTLLKVAHTAVSSHARQQHPLGLPRLDLPLVIERVLRSQTRWAIWCFRDFDQYPVVRRPMSPDEVAKQLRENIGPSPARQDFVAWSPEVQG
jgi:hypothetical protein